MVNKIYTIHYLHYNSQIRIYNIKKIHLTKIRKYTFFGNAKIYGTLLVCFGSNSSAGLSFQPERN